MDATSIYQEGYRIGPTRLYREGVPQTEILDFLTRNSRLPRSVWGDMHAQIAACRTGENRLQALYDKFGETVIREATEEIWRQCEVLDHEVVSQIPDGIYEESGALDSEGPGGKPVPIKVKVTVSGDQIELDLRGSSPQTGGPLNCGVVQIPCKFRCSSNCRNI
jgi:N-methylhydantoinase B